MSEIPKACAARIMKGTGAERISSDSVDTFIEALEDYGEEIASKATKYAQHANRKTVQVSDIKLALR
jgi:histone H3/H4